MKRKNTHDVSVFSIVCVYMKSANVPMAAKRQKQNLLLLCVERCYHMLMHRASCGSALTTCWIWNEWVWGRVNRQNFDLKFIMAPLLGMNGQCFERKSSDIGRVHVEMVGTQINIQRSWTIESIFQLFIDVIVVTTNLWFKTEEKYFSIRKSYKMKKNSTISWTFFLQSIYLRSLDLEEFLNFYFQFQKSYVWYWHGCQFAIQLNSIWCDPCWIRRSIHYFTNLWDPKYVIDCQ